MVNWPISTKIIELVKRKGIIEGKTIVVKKNTKSIKNSRRKKKIENRKYRIVVKN